jgi:hypothetical protein
VLRQRQSGSRLAVLGQLELFLPPAPLQRARRDSMLEDKRTASRGVYRSDRVASTTPGDRCRARELGRHLIDPAFWCASSTNRALGSPGCLLDTMCCWKLALRRRPPPHRG